MAKVPMSEVTARRDVISRALRNRKYEVSPSGLFFPKVAGGLAICGHFDVWVNGKDHSVEPNLVTNEGLNYLLDVGLEAGTPITTWYIAPFSGNVTPAAGTTAATFTAVTTEATAYDEATRVTWATDAVASQAVANDTTRATFTINASINVYGAGIISASAKSATTGKLFAYAKFSAVRAMVDNDVLTIKYTISATSS